MSKQQATREEINALAADGWRFRKKPRKGNLYVSARKGKKEKGLGPYSDELWAMIEDVNGSQAKKQESLKGLTQTRRVVEETDYPWIKMFEEIDRHILRYKSLNCLHRGDDGFCGYWRLEELPEHVKQPSQKDLDFVFKKLSQDDGKSEVWALRVLPVICRNCPAYVDEKTINFINLRRRRAR